jgi:predicted O-methyltransferase YrrM
MFFDVVTHAANIFKSMHYFIIYPKSCARKHKQLDLDMPCKMPMLVNLYFKVYSCIIMKTASVSPPLLEAAIERKGIKGLRGGIVEFIKRHDLLYAVARQALRAKIAADLVSVQRKGLLAEFNSWHGLKRLSAMEGFMRPEQAAFFERLIKANPHIRNIAEIGFNAGHSSFVFLESSERTRVTSFDIATHDYVDGAATYIDGRFPGRFNLIRGDSKQTVPQFAADNPDTKFDLVFVDGGHDLETTRADIANVRQFASEHTMLVVDDILPDANYGVGPSQAWQEALAGNVVMQDGLLHGDNRTWAVGRFI